MSNSYVGFPSGFDIYVRDYGDPGDPCVVLLHDLLFPMWGDLPALLQEAGYWVVAPHFPGHGSSTSLDQEYTLSDLANWTSAALSSVVGAPSHIVGLSMGGMVALGLAIAHDWLVKTLFLIGTSAQAEPAGFYQRRVSLAERLRNAWMLDGLGRRKLVEKELLPLYFASGDSALLTKWANYLMGVLSSRDSCFYFYLAAMSVFERDGLEDDELEWIGMPVFVARGALDTFRTAQEADFLYHTLVDARDQVVWGGLGHHCVLEDPQRVASEIIGFLGRVEEKENKLWIPTT